MPFSEKGLEPLVWCNQTLCDVTMVNRASDLPILTIFFNKLCAVSTDLAQNTFSVHLKPQLFRPVRLLFMKRFWLVPGRRYINVLLLTLPTNPSAALRIDFTHAC